MHFTIKCLKDFIDKEKISDEELSKIKKLITILSEEKELIAKCHKVLGATPEMEIDVSEDFSLNMRVEDDDKGCPTLLHLAAGRSHVEIVRALIDAGVDPNIQDDNGDTALILAIHLSARVEVMRALIAARAKVDIQNHFGATALMKASGFGLFEFVSVLMDAKANPDVQKKKGHTALMFAISEGRRANNAIWSYCDQDNYRDVVLTLICAGMNLDLVSQHGNTAFDIAVQPDVEVTPDDLSSQELSFFIVKLLLSHGATVSSDQAVSISRFLHTFCEELQKEKQRLSGMKHEDILPDQDKKKRLRTNIDDLLEEAEGYLNRFAVKKARQIDQETGGNIPSDLLNIIFEYDAQLHGLKAAGLFSGQKRAAKYKLNDNILLLEEKEESQIKRHKISGGKSAMT